MVRSTPAPAPRQRRLDAAGGAYSGGHVSHTGQLLFDDAITTRVYKLAPYSSNTAARTLNTADRFYTEQGGAKSLLELSVGAKPPGSVRKRAWIFG